MTVDRALETRGRMLPTNSRTLLSLDPAFKTSGSTLPTNSRPLLPGRVPLEIVGNALPSISMAIQSKIEKLTTAREVMQGVSKHLADRSVLTVAGNKVTPDEIIARYQAQIAAIDRVRETLAVYKTALAAEKRMRRPMQKFTVDFKQVVLMELGPDKLPAFGWKAPKPPGPKTVASKMAGVEKRAAKKRSG